MKFIQQYQKQISYSIGIILLSLIAIYPLFHKGFFVTDDGEWMLIRFTAFHQALLDGQFPVRWLGRLNFSYGYPAANFMYPGFMYLGELLRLFHIGYITTIKLLLGISLISSGVFTYLWLRQKFADFPSFIAGLLYVFAPYHLFDIYARGSVGEVVALAVIPFILWVMDLRNLFFTSLGIALLILSHKTLAALFLPVIVLYYLFSNKRGEYWYLVKSVGLGMGLVSFFWIPALYDLQYTVFSQTPISSISAYFSESKIQVLSVFSFIYLSFTCIVSFLLYRPVKNLSSPIKRVTIFFLLLLMIVLLLNLSYSEFVWKILPISFIQFPFRLFAVEMLTVSFLSSMLLSLLKGKIQYVVSVILLLFLSIPTFFFIPTIEYMDKGDDYYATNEATTTIKNEYMPIWAKESFSNRPDTIIKEQIPVSQIIKKSNRISFAITVPEATVITVNQLYFPGWKRLVDGESTSVSPDSSTGLIRTVVEKDQKEVVLVFAETPLRLFSDILSLSSLGILVILSIKRYKKHEIK